MQEYYTASDQFLKKNTPESSRLEFLEKFSADNFPLSDAEHKTSWPLYRGVTTAFIFVEMIIPTTKENPVIVQR